MRRANGQRDHRAFKGPVPPPTDVFLPAPATVPVSVLPGLPRLPRTSNSPPPPRQRPLLLLVISQALRAPAATLEVTSVPVSESSHLFAVRLLSVLSAACARKSAAKTEESHGTAKPAHAEVHGG